MGEKLTKAELEAIFRRWEREEAEVIEVIEVIEAVGKYLGRKPAASPSNPEPSNGTP